MSAKIQLKSDLVGTFGGIFLMLDHFNKAGLDKLVDKLLGNRRFNAKYSYSDIFKTLLATYATNGSCIEDSRRISGQISEKSQDYRLCSPDILLNSFKELCTGSSASHSESGIEYRFNHNPALTSLAVKGLIQCGQVDTKTAHVFDYDNLSEERMPTKPDWLAKPKKGLEETSSYQQRSMTPSSPTRRFSDTFPASPRLTDTHSSLRTGTATPM